LFGRVTPELNQSDGATLDQLGRLIWSCRVGASGKPGAVRPATTPQPKSSSTVLTSQIGLDLTAIDADWYVTDVRVDGALWLRPSTFAYNELDDYALLAEPIDAALHCRLMARVR
jgi:hypothetical protein